MKRKTVTLAELLIMLVHADDSLHLPVLFEWEGVLVGITDKDAQVTTEVIDGIKYLIIDVSEQFREFEKELT